MEEQRLVVLKWVWLSGVALFLVQPVFGQQTLSFSSNIKTYNRKISPFPSHSSPSNESTYAVIVDAGSSGSRVHVFHFNSDMDLVSIGKDLDISKKVTPGLSSYADEPQKAADSLVPLLDLAEAYVPSQSRPQSPILLGATAGLRLLDESKAERILRAVRKLFKTKTTFKYKAKGVNIITGNQEGTYMWATINYLLKNLGQNYSKTVGVVDLGGASVQMAYAISEKDAAKAPRPPQNEDAYIQPFYFKGTKYFLYVHSYLRYGGQAARGKILRVTRNSTNPCILAGYHGTYKYQGKEYKASASPLGPDLKECKRVILKAMRVGRPCNYSACSFNGVWNGGGGYGSDNLYFASSFYDNPSQSGIIDSKKKVVKVRAADFMKAAEWVCLTKYKDAKATFPNYFQESLQYVCMDILYQYSLIVHGFGVDPNKRISLVSKLEYHGSLVDVAWPLGNALEVVSKNDEALFITS